MMSIATWINVLRFKETATSLSDPQGLLESTKVNHKLYSYIARKEVSIVESKTRPL